ncbi:hypothetical protein PybrP1_012458 [[Pythium] brassicae (nom. inval.)]|nr:hypothetical protein PybrP1_012458 [[Pythium] brassicae (nom. inval.)]
MSSNAPAVAVPGQRLAPLAQHRAGSGTYARDGAIFASVLGTWTISPPGNEVSVARGGGRPLASAQVLRLGDVVVCRVTKVTARQVLVDIAAVRGIALPEPFPGTIRLEDVRSHDVDKLTMEDVFASGALVKAAVLSFGDTRSYFLSTARPGLGVVRVSPLQDDGSAAMETD